jgi:PAS domain S-box-containing protein/putative nucleotidyltransferase with HDIG domain
MDMKVYKALFERSRTPTLYVVSKRVELANRRAKKLFKRLGIDDVEGVLFGKIWPKRTKASIRGGITALKGVTPGEYGLTTPDGTELAVEITSLTGKPPARRVVFIEDITEPKLSEKVLRESEERYRVMAETALAGIWITDPNENMIFVNPALAKMLGYSKDELVGTNIAQLTDREGFAKYREGTQLRKKGIPNQYESTLRHKDGTLINVLVSASPLTAPDGRYEATVGYVADITKRKRVEEALRESEEFNRSVVENSPLGISVRSRTGELLGVNEEWKRIWGISEKRLAKELAKEKDKLEFDRRDEYLGDWLPEVEKVYAEGVYLHIPEAELLDPKEGGACWVSHYFYPIKDAEDRVDRVVILTEDITDRKLAESALRVSEEKYRALFDNAGNPITYLTADGTILLINTVGARNLGGTPDDFVGKSIYKSLPDIADRTRERIRQVVESKAGCSFEDLIDLPSGGRWFSSDFQPVIDASGKVFGVQIVSQDITERKRAEEALKASQEYIQNIVSSSPDMIVSVDNDRRIVEFNEAAQGAFGYAKEEVIGKHIDMLYDDPEEGRKVVENIRTAGNFFGEVTNVRKNGERFPSYLSASLLRDGGGEVVGVMGVSRDITIEKRVTEALKESQRRFATLVEAALEGIGIVDAEENIVYTNTAFAETLGYSVEEIIEMNISQLVPDEQFEKILAETEKRKRGETTTYEVEFTHRDGSPRYFVVSVSPMFGRDGVYEGAYAVFLDITERKRVEEEKERLHAEVVAAMSEREALFDGVDVLLWSVRERDDGRLYYEQANAAFAAVEGRMPEHYEGKLVGELHTAEECERIWNSYEWAKLGKLRIYETQFGREPDIRYFVIRIIPLPEPDGSIRSFLASGMDITDRRMAEEAVRESEEKYRTFTEEAIVGVYIYRGGRFYFVNKEMEVITGYSKDELLTISTDELVNPEDREYLVEREKARRKGDDLPARYSMRIKRKNGEPAVLMVGSKPIQYGGETAYLGNCVDITENVKAQEALKSEKEKAQQYLDIAAVMLVVIGSDYKVRMINRKGCELLGCAEEEIIGKNWFSNFIPKRVRNDIKTRFEKLMAGEKEPEEYFENPVLTRNGEERIILWHTTVLKDENGSIVGGLSSGEDITERKLAEKALEREHFAFKIIAEASVHAADVTDLCRRVITGLVNTLGFDAGTFRLSDYDEGKRFLKLVASFGLSAKEKELSGVPQSIDDSRYVAAFVARSGQPIIAPDVSKEEVLKPFKSRLGKFGEESLISWPVLSASEDIMGVLHLWSRKHVDISEGDRAFFERVAGMFASVLERKRTEEALRESEKRIRQFAETVPDLLYKWNQRECRYDFLSPAFEKITGYSLEEIYADPCDFQQKLIHPDETVRIMKIVNDYAAGGPKDEPLVVETRLVRADGEVIWVRDSMVYEWDDERLSKVIGVMSDITERKQAEESVRESEERLRKFAETVPDVLYRFDTRDYVYDFLSPSFEKMTGYPLSEIHANPSYFQLKLIHPDDKIRVTKTVNEYAAGKPKDKPLVLETRMIRADGEVIWVRNSMVYEWDDEGLSEVIGVMSDITDQKRSEKALRESEIRFRRFTDTVTDMIYRFDLERSEYDFISPSCEVITGYSVDEFNADPKNLWESLIHSEDVERIIKKRDEQMVNGDSGNFFDLEYRIVRKDGEIVWVNEQGNYEVDEKGETTIFNGVVRDITERKRAEAAVQDSLTKLQKSLRGTVSTISKIVETRDPYTSGHQTRVAKLARSIAAKMGLEDEQVELIYVAALVHDIGKISVPQEILSKPTKLTELEWNIIKMHPEVGCEILENVEFPWPVTDVVMQHHERLNGSGYPRGLEGGSIMLEARILSLADVVEAMSSHRPYRPELGIDKALDEISINKGVLYDDEVVNACIDLFELDGFEFDQNT